MQTVTTQRWLERWDRQQERYVGDREGRFAAVADVVAWAADRLGVAEHAVVDLGCGPGSLGVRLAAALSGARVVGIDADPVLLALAEGLVDGERVRVVRGDLTDPAWPALIDLPSPWTAAVSSTALHWLSPDQLAGLFRVLAANLPPGGVFVDADHRRPSAPASDDLARYLGAAQIVSEGSAGNEEWTAWWEALGADPDVEFDVARPHGHTGNALSIEEQSAMLLDAGFREVTTAWQHGDNHVLVGIR